MHHRSTTRLNISPGHPLILIANKSLKTRDLGHTVTSSTTSLLTRTRVVRLAKQNGVDRMHRLIATSTNTSILANVNPRSTKRNSCRATRCLRQVSLTFTYTSLIVYHTKTKSMSRLTTLNLPTVCIPLPVNGNRRHFGTRPIIGTNNNLLITSGSLAPR